MTTQELIDAISGGAGALVVLVGGVVAILRGWLVPAAAYRRECERADRLETLLHRAIGVSERGLDVAHRAIGAGEGGAA